MSDARKPSEKAARPPVARPVNEIGEFLYALGWTAPCDAQWTKLEAALPELRDLLITCGADHD